MGVLKDKIKKANSFQKIEELLSLCLIKLAEFLNTSSVHAAIDHSGYWINGNFYTNKEMVQDFINKFKDSKNPNDDLDWLNLDKPTKSKKLSKTTLDSLKSSKAIVSTKPNKINNLSKVKRGRPSHENKNIN